MIIDEVSVEIARQFLDTYHPMGAGGCLRGMKHAIMAYEDGWPTMLAVFVYPRSRWRKRVVVLELSRLAWSPLAKRSVTTFLRKCLRQLRQQYSGEIVTYAMPDTTGIVYERAGFMHDGYSSGALWSRRGPGERPTPETIGSGRKLARFFAPV